MHIPFNLTASVTQIKYYCGPLLVQLSSQLQVRMISPSTHMYLFTPRLKNHVIYSSNRAERKSHDDIGFQNQLVVSWAFMVVPSVAQWSCRALAFHLWGCEFESEWERSRCYSNPVLYSREKSWSTHWRKSWVFSGHSGFLPQGSWQGWLG